MRTKSPSPTPTSTSPPPPRPSSTVPAEPAPAPAPGWNSTGSGRSCSDSPRPPMPPSAARPGSCEAGTGPRYCAAATAGSASPRSNPSATPGWRPPTICAATATSASTSAPTREHETNGPIRRQAQRSPRTAADRPTKQRSAPGPGESCERRNRQGRDEPASTHRLGSPGRCRDQGRLCEPAAPAKLTRVHMNAQDAAFTTELTYGALRRQKFYDAVIEIAASRSVDAIDAEPLAAMRLGAHQLLSMRVPDHAALSETVAVVKRTAAKTAGFVNAVLRRISETDGQVWLDRVTDGASETTRAAIEHSHPEWIVRALAQA